MKEFLHLCSENCISWIFGHFFKNAHKWKPHHWNPQEPRTRCSILAPLSPLVWVLQPSFRKTVYLVKVLKVVLLFKIVFKILLYRAVVLQLHHFLLDSLFGALGKYVSAPGSWAHKIPVRKTVPHIFDFTVYSTSENWVFHLHWKYIQCNLYSFSMCPTVHCNPTALYCLHLIAFPSTVE